jgi:hypothetical protein
MTEASGKYEALLDALVRWNVVTREQAASDCLREPLQCGAYRESLRHAQARAEEARDRREWITGVKRRLGLVCAGDVAHRVRVVKVPGGHGWLWHCRMRPCRAYGIGYGSLPEAFGAAWDHATIGR